MLRSPNNYCDTNFFLMKEKNKKKRDLFSFAFVHGTNKKPVREKSLFLKITVQIKSETLFKVRIATNMVVVCAGRFVSAETVCCMAGGSPFLLL